MKLKSGWGMTETCSPGTGHPAGGPDKPGSIGLMLPGIEMDVVALDDPSKILPPGEVGEIRIRGPNVTKGYWNRPEETAEAFVGDRFLTGDIGYMDADGYFYLVDRKKDMIISGGFNVYPQMIEQAIYEHPAVQEVIVIGISRRLPRRGGEGVCQTAGRRQPVHAGRAEGVPRRQARQARNSRRRSISSTSCRARRSANCRATNCATSSPSRIPARPKQQQLATGGRS